MRTVGLASLLWLAAVGAAGGAEREYGFAAGLGTLLAPADALGVSLSLSAAVSPSWGGRRLVRARGELQGFIADGAWAALPTISGDVGLRLGRLNLYLTGGLELFGGARRAGITVFANLGLTGGAGLGVRLTPRLRLGVRSMLSWLPSFGAVRLAGPEGDQPSWLFLSGLLSLELVGGVVHDDLDFDDFEARAGVLSAVHKDRGL